VSDPAVLARTDRASVCAPAGYGKTHLIGHALLAGPNERHLILTHTHAGVHALRKRLTLLGVPRNRYRIDTIAGWALYYAQAFPTTTGYTKPATAFQENWPTIYNGVAALLRTSPAKTIVNATYSGVYVDEYQDCSLPQHALITGMAALIPCRVLGDPLQAIFNFAEPTVDWHHDVLTAFPALPPLTQPHRWNHDPAFAAWLQQVRIALESNQALNLRSGLPPAVRVIRHQTFLERNRAIQQCVNQKRTTGTTIVITQWPRQCHELARQTPGVLVIEPVDGEDFATAATALAAPTGAERVSNVLSFAATCFTGFDQQLRQRLSGAAQGTIRPRNTTHAPQIAALKAVYNSNDLAPIPEALVALANIGGVRVTRPELYYEVRRAFIVFREGGHDTIQDALAATRQRTRQAGRKLTDQTMGRTLLIKGLEFEHAVLIAPEDLNTQNLYVAMTRGTNSLTIVTNANTLHPGQQPAT
jgi:DNA helicase-2/ATP-dependent DNA helicase PcrA